MPTEDGKKSETNKKEHGISRHSEDGFAVSTCTHPATSTPAVFQGY